MTATPLTANSRSATSLAPQLVADTATAADPVDAPTTATSRLRHGLVENALALVTGTFVVSLGLHLLQGVHSVTGGTAGLALLLSYATGWSFGVLYLLVTLPFVVLAWRLKGPAFTLRTLVALGLTVALVGFHPVTLPDAPLSPLYGTLAGNLLVGLGMLIVFRHGASLGGVNTVAVLVQERRGWPAGLVQLGMDAAIIGSALAVVSPIQVGMSALGAALVGAVLTLNHRPGRYAGF